MKTNSPQIKKNFLEGDEDDITNFKITSNNTTKNSYTNKFNDNITSDHSNMNLIELINSLKEKIAVYEKDIENLIDEKLEMQIEINNLKLDKIKYKKKNSGFLENNPNLSKLVEINEQLKKQNEDMKNEIDKLNSIIEKQNEIVKSNQFQIEKNKNNNNNDNVINNENYKCPNCEKKNDELKKLTNEKMDIMLAISELKKQLEALKANEKKRKNKKMKEKINKNESLPNIEQYFILNNKFQLVDKNRNLWHMKRCNKFQEFKEKNKNIYKSSDEILKAFVDSYENKNQEENIELPINNNNNNNNINYNINENITQKKEKNSDFNTNENKNSNIKEDTSLSLSDNSS